MTVGHHIHKFSFGPAGALRVLKPGERAVERLAIPHEGPVRVLAMRFASPEAELCTMSAMVTAVTPDASWTSKPIPKLVLPSVHVGIREFAMEAGDALFLEVTNLGDRDVLVRGEVHYAPVPTDAIVAVPVEASGGPKFGGPTPGPWVRSERARDSVIASEPDREISSTEAEAYGGQVIAESIERRNVPLIMCAPELLEMCRKIRRGEAGVRAMKFWSDRDEGKFWSEMDELIARAEGRRT